MRAAQWIAVVLLAVIAGLQGYALVPAVQPTPPPANRVAEADERVELGRLRLDRMQGKLEPNDAEYLRLLEQRDAARRIKDLGGSY
jgi:hypothetical protein